MQVLEFNKRALGGDHPHTPDHHGQPGIDVLELRKVQSMPLIERPIYHIVESGLTCCHLLGVGC
jgi:hypothetical protein